MHVFIAFSSVLSAFGSVILATDTGKAVLEMPLSTPDDFQQYYLKTQLTPGQQNERFSDLYVQAYHTGAGLSDAVLSTTPKTTAYTNGTKVLFDYYPGHGSFYPWNLILAVNKTYTDRAPVQINTAFGQEYGRYYLDDDHGLQWTSDTAQPEFDEFAGWKVCDGWHHVPQLFWKMSYFEDPDMKPSSCSDVYLMPEYV